MAVVKFRPVEEYKERADRVFENQKEIILGKLPFAQVEHIGSTAIPGSLTKGDLDVNVRVEKDRFSEAVDALKQLYDINQPDNWEDDFASFKTDKLEIDFGVQLTVLHSRSDVFAKKRDALINNSVLVKKLNEIKRKYNWMSMDEYRKGKANFFESILY